MHIKEMKHVDDVEAWLAPMEYEEFWYVIKDYYLVLPNKESCDIQIASGEVERDLVLEVLKRMARLALTKRHRLKYRMSTPWLRVVK